MADQLLARMLWNRGELSGAKPAQQFKHRGAWKTLTWREVGEIVREISTGLVALGRRRGEAVGILSASRAEWVQADFAIFTARGVTIPIYPTYPPDLIQYIVNDAAVKPVIVEGNVRLLFLPLAHSFGRLESFIGVHRGLCTAFAESIDKLRENLPETRPHFICSVPRVFEKVYAGALAKADGGSPIKRKIFW